MGYLSESEVRLDHSNSADSIFVNKVRSRPDQGGGPIFIRENAVNTPVGHNVIPNFLLHRVLSVRGYDKDYLMQEANITAGDELNVIIKRLFKSAELIYLHIHNVKTGYFLCFVYRV
ncbi:DUF1203 domain-containing protein [Shewanella surugensis]|uniref:DUF1203 domain-containing protein n=1 Tax=Shewanella surugensis TaxID=212020 RepID=A0ABT0LKA5_9GAMM|nr:DUF1203 domain-containing protein [Shewanella surugensis]MCL1128034.1 DUF1203 domain-containing protein [Shewanella surugensis]